MLENDTFDHAAKAGQNGVQANVSEGGWYSAAGRGT